MSDRPKSSSGLSRRRFVAVLAAGSAALIARPAGAVAPPPRPRAAAPALTAAQRKEYDRQRASTLETLEAIRAHAMPPGTEMASVFRARRPARKAR